MLKTLLIIAALTGAFSSASVIAEEKIYGSQYMTQKQRVEYRSMILAANTAEGKEQIRKVHQELMKKRARERGTILADIPLGRDMIPGGGMSPPIAGMVEN